MKNMIKEWKKVKEIISVSRKGNFSIFKIFVFLLVRILEFLLFKVFRIYELKNYIEDCRKQVQNIKNLERICKDVDDLTNSCNDDNIQETHLNLVDDNHEKIFVWFVPGWNNVWGGGHYTLFRFSNYFANQHKVRNIIYIYDYDIKSNLTVLAIEQELSQALPNCRLKIETDFAKLPSCHAAIATTWQSAYFVKKFTSAVKKFYFMQDYESLFYPAGSLSMCANHTYNFGFYGITGGTWLRKIYESYHGEAVNYIFSTDRNIFYPKVRDKLLDVKRIFFYGRPSTERRAYELGIVALQKIAVKYPDIEIIIAGLNKINKPKFNCTLLGNLSLKETGELYRTCDIGIALSATNLSYLPVELMASGCPVITNNGPQVEWYCKNEYNCLTANPTITDVVRCVDELVNSSDLRRTLIDNGLKTAEQTTWENEMEKVYQYINDKINL